MTRRLRRRQRARDMARRRENKRLPPDLMDPIFGPIEEEIKYKVWFWYLRNHWHNKKMPRPLHWFFRWFF